MPSYVLQPEVLRSRQLWLLRLALPVLFSVLACGIAGLSILIGAPWSPNKRPPFLPVPPLCTPR